MKISTNNNILRLTYLLIVGLLPTMLLLVILLSKPLTIKGTAIFTLIVSTLYFIVYRIAYSDYDVYIKNDEIVFYRNKITIKINLHEYSNIKVEFISLSLTYGMGMYYFKIGEKKYRVRYDFKTPRTYFPTKYLPLETNKLHQDIQYLIAKLNK